MSSIVTHEPITLKNGSLVRWKPLEASPDNPKIPHPFSGDKQVCIYISLTTASLEIIIWLGFMVAIMSVIRWLYEAF